MSVNVELLNLRWSALFEHVENSREVNGVFNDLVGLYTNPQRYYHNLAHIKACLTHLDEVTHYIDNKRIVELALWFHDVIYHPGKSNNELLSARFAERSLALFDYTEQDIQQVSHLVNLTKHPSKPESNDEKFLIDIDLAILGAGEPLYQNYSKWVRMEFHRVPSVLYKKGRKNILQEFLDMERIYQTDLFYHLYEKRARRNMLAELQQLSQSFKIFGGFSKKLFSHK